MGNADVMLFEPNVYDLQRLNMDRFDISWKGVVNPCALVASARDAMGLLTIRTLTLNTCLSFRIKLAYSEYLHLKQCRERIFCSSQTTESGFWILK